MYIDFMLKVFEENKDKVAVVYREEEYNYGWLLEKYYYWKEELSNNNIEENSVVAVKSDFNPDSIALLLAVIENGNIFVPISPAVKSPEYYIEVGEVEYVIDLMGDKIEYIKTGLNVDHELLKELKENRKSPGLILFSSGTTGKPKGALHDMVPLLNKFKVKRHTLVTITFLLFDHIGGFNTLMYILSNGGTIVAIEDRNPEEVCRMIEKYQVELLPTSPTFINMILFSKAYEKYSLDSLKIVSYGTEPMPQTTLNAFHNIFKNIRLKQTYGLSEIGIMRSKSESSDSLWVKVGGEDYETKIVDGKFLIKAKTAMMGYLNAPSPFDKDGWFHTGDRVEQKGEYIRFLGRDSEIINVGGEKVYPIEVESVILEMESALDAAVHGEDHPMMGKVVVANIRVSEEDNNKDFIKEVKKHCRARLEKFKIPVKITLTTENLNNARFKRMR
ncbi:MAG: fatty acid--CoA ligase family protein [Firmicutes bacterium]|jgi:acyl-coenzyme A synthetase/AMP-(fatty) acid ligase|nr:fatty acid--CoA ligase family protein [Bacillota bacterium]